MSDLVDKLEERAVSYEQSGPSAHHTAALLREAKFEIENLRSRTPAQQAVGCGKSWSPDQFWEYVGGLVGDFERDQMHDTLAERGLSLTSTERGGSDV